jgi:hypothetical protein
MDVVFSIQAKLFGVFRDSDGSIHWSDYDGQKVNAALPSAEGESCILLLYRDFMKRSPVSNLFCVDRGGNTLWKVELSEPRDPFVEARMEADGLHATSLGGRSLTLDPADGRVIECKFVK